jgi:gliding motility-associated-like protein
MKALIYCIACILFFSFPTLLLSQGSGHCLQFDGISSRVVIPDDPSFDHPTKNIAIEAWINPSSYPSGGGGILTKHSTMGTREYSLFLLADGRIRFDVFDNSSTDYLTYSTITVPLNRWTHVAGIYSYAEGRSRIYINGILNQVVNIGQIEIASTTIPPMIGAYWYPGGPTTTRAHFAGQIDEVRLWYSARGLGDIRFNMCRSITAASLNLIAYYKMDETNGTTLIDVANNNDGVLTNFSSTQTTSRLFSSAPIGNQSNTVYTNDWSAVNGGLSSSNSSFIVTDFIGDPVGVHVYYVNALPNSITGITSNPNTEYYGTFLLNETGVTYSAVHDYNNCTETFLYMRDHNADMTWTNTSATNNITSKTLTKQNLTSRGEFIINLALENNIILGNDTALCSGENLLLDLGPGYDNYEWQDGSTMQTYTICSAGEYWVEVTKDNCTSSDTIEVSIVNPPTLDLGNDTSICSGKNLVLNPGTGFDQYKWQDGLSLQQYTASSEGKYWVEISEDNCKASDTIQITIFQSPVIELGHDTSICSGTTLVLNAGSGFDSYEWQNSSFIQTQSISSAGKYWVKISENNCSNSDTIKIIVINAPVVNLGKDTSICSKSSLTFDLTSDNIDHYQWQDNSINPTFQTSGEGTYFVTVSNKCGIARDSIELTTLTISIPNLITPNQDDKNDTFEIPANKEGKGSLSIYNRWGDQVYENFQYKNDWTGQDLSENIYYYLFTYPGCDSYKGWVQIIK